MNFLASRSVSFSGRTSKWIILALQSIQTFLLCALYYFLQVRKPVTLLPKVSQISCPRKIGYRWILDRSARARQDIYTQKLLLKICGPRHYLESHFVLCDRHTSKINLGPPWGLSGKESTYQWRRRGFDPWSGKIPYAVEQLSPFAATSKLVLQSLGARAPRPSCSRAARDATAVRSWHAAPGK